jgi:hypothetical protein
MKLIHWIKTKPGLFLLLACTAVLCIAAAPAGRDYVISTLTVWPAASENGTNSVIVKSKGGTNWWGIDPTNALLATRIRGTNYTAVYETNLFITNGGVAYPFKVRNGLIVY